MPPRDPLPDNGELAAVFQTIADYLSLDGASVYRTLAYEKAAETFQGHPTSVAELALRGELRTLPGVGTAVESKVAEYLDSGAIAMLEQLRESDANVLGVVLNNIRRNYTYDYGYYHYYYSHKRGYPYKTNDVLQAQEEASTPPVEPTG